MLEQSVANLNKAARCSDPYTLRCTTAHPCPCPCPCPHAKTTCRMPRDRSRTSSLRFVRVPSTASKNEVFRVSFPGKIAKSNEVAKWHKFIFREDFQHLTCLVLREGCMLPCCMCWEVREQAKNGPVLLASLPGSLKSCPSCRRRATVAQAAQAGQAAQPLPRVARAWPYVYYRYRHLPSPCARALLAPTRKPFTSGGCASTSTAAPQQ